MIKVMGRIFLGNVLGIRDKGLGMRYFLGIRDWEPQIAQMGTDFHGFFSFFVGREGGLLLFLICASSVAICENLWLRLAAIVRSAAATLDEEGTGYGGEDGDDDVDPFLDGFFCCGHGVVF